MLKLTYLVKRRSDLSQAEFERLWKDAHANLVASKADALGAIGYTMNLRTKCSREACMTYSRGFNAPMFDGVIEIWWADAAAYDAKMGRPEGLAVFDMLSAAERSFMDIDKSQAFFTDQTVIFNHADPMPA